MVNFLAAVFSFAVFTPIIIILYLTISKKLSTKPVISGILSFMLIYIITQFFLVALSKTGLAAANPAIAVSLWGIFMGIAAVFVIFFIQKKVVPDSDFRDSLGIGLGLGTVWMLSTVGPVLFFSLMMAITIVSGGANPADMTAEALEAYNQAKANFESKAPLDYILLSAGGISLLVVMMSISVMIFEYIKTTDKKFLIYTTAAAIAVIVPFIFAAELGIVNIYVQICMLVLAAGAIWFMVYESKKYPSAETTPFSRQSPLEGRDFTGRIKKRKK